MNERELLRELEPLTFSARFKRMVELGRLAPTDPAVAETIAALSRGGFYERLLATQSCFGSRDSAQVLRARSDASRCIRGVALLLIPLVCGDAEVVAVLQESTLEQQRALMKRLHARNRFAPVNAFLAGLLETADATTPRLLAFGSPEFVGQHVTTAMERASASDWARVALRHPALVADELRRRAEAATERDPRLIWQVNAVLGALAERAPDAAVALVRALARHTALAQLALNSLARRRPEEMAALALEHEERPGVDFAALAHRLPPERLRALLAHPATTFRPAAGWLRRLRPNQRLALYRDFGRGWRDGNEALDRCLVLQLHIS